MSHKAMACLVLLCVSAQSVSAQDPCVWVERLSSPTQPAARGLGMAYDAARDECVVFGGSRNEGGQWGETWSWNGTTWTHRLEEDSTGTTAPKPRASLAMAYDSKRKVVVLFGGGDASGPLGDTWEWNGKVWTKVHPGDPAGILAPPRRSQHSLAYDAARQKVVLFGGVVGPSTLIGDTWEWDGTVWTKVHHGDPAGILAPLARSLLGMTYDAAREVTVVFGGANLSVVFDDTWEWNGTVWTLCPGSGPSMRRGARMTYHSKDNVVMLFGGQNRPLGSGPPYFSDLWKRDGKVWTKICENGPMAKRFGAGFAYDEARTVVVVAGGTIVGGVDEEGGDDTWELMPIGACCKHDGTCDDTVTEVGCRKVDGAFQGGGTFCLGDSDANGLDDICETNVPTASEWSLAATLLLMLTAGTLVVRRQQVLRT